VRNNSGSWLLRFVAAGSSVVYATVTLMIYALATLSSPSQPSSHERFMRPLPILDYPPNCVCVCSVLVSDMGCDLGLMRTTVFEGMGVLNDERQGRDTIPGL